MAGTLLVPAFSGTHVVGFVRAKYIILMLRRLLLSLRENVLVRVMPFSKAVASYMTSVHLTRCGPVTGGEGRQSLGMFSCFAFLSFVRFFVPVFTLVRMCFPSGGSFMTRR